MFYLKIPHTGSSVLVKETITSVKPSALRASKAVLNISALWNSVSPQEQLKISHVIVNISSMSTQ